MLKVTALAALTAAMLASPIASAQVIDLGGRGGPRVDLRSDEQRYDDRARRRMRRDMADERGYGRGRGDGCRTVSVTRTDDFGRRVTRTRREC